MAVITQNYPAQTAVIHTNFYTQSLKSNPDDGFELAAYTSREDMRSFIAEQSYYGLGLYYEGPQLTTVNYDQPGQAYKAVLGFATFKLACEVSKEMLMEDEFGIVPTIPQMLRFSAQLTRNKKIWALLNLAFTSTVLGGDGVALASTAHPLAKIPGVTLSNSQGTAAISPSVIQTMLLNYQLYKDDTNNEDFRTPVKLWVPPQLQQAAQEIIGTGPKAPYTTNNTINIHMGRLEVGVSRFLTSSTAYFIVGNKCPDVVNGHQLEFAPDAHRLKYAEEWPESITIFDAPAVLGLNIMGDLRFGVFFSDWRAVECAQGA